MVVVKNAPKSIKIDPFTKIPKSELQRNKTRNMTLPYFNAIMQMADKFDLVDTKYKSVNLFSCAIIRREHERHF